MRSHRGIYYFPDRATAYAYASANSLPTSRIIPYTRGWAIQLKISGPYAGPAVMAMLLEHGSTP